MSHLLVFGLLIQLTAVLLVLHRVKGKFLTYSGAIFVLIACIYHGVTEVVQFFFPGHDPYRELVSQPQVDEWVIIASFGILLFAVSYTLALGTRPGPQPSFEKAEEAIPYMPDWRLLLAIALPAFWLRMSGHEVGYWIRSIADYLSNFALVLASVSYILKNGESSVLPVLVIQSAMLAVSGARSFVVLNGLILFSALMRLGIPIRLRRLAFACGLMAVLAVAISVARQIGGRLDQMAEPADTGSRVSWMLRGLEGLKSPGMVAESVARDFIYRIDGNSFNAMVNEKIGRGAEVAGLESLWNDLHLMVPSFIAPAKLDEEKTFLFEEDYTVWHYGLPTGIDYIPGVTGVLFSYYGTPLFLAAMLILGLSYAIIDRWLNRSRTFFAQLAGMGFVYSALFQEFGILIYFTTFRSLLLLYIFLTPLMAVHLTGKWFASQHSLRHPARCPEGVNPPGNLTEPFD